MQHTLKFLLFGICVVFLSSTLLGCKKEAKLKGVYPIKGKVTYKGEAVEDASIKLVPQTLSGEIRAAGARSDANGEFSVTTLSPGDGAFPGAYTITVSKMVSDKTYTQAEIDEANEKGISLAQSSTNQLPAKYANPKQSGLTVTVLAGANEDLVLDLVD